MMKPEHVSMYTLGSEIGHTQHVKDVDCRNHPLNNSGIVVRFAVAEHAKGDCQRELDQNESKLHPETDAQVAMLTKVDAEPLILGTDEYSRDDITATFRSAMHTQTLNGETYMKTQSMASCTR